MMQKMPEPVGSVKANFLSPAFSIPDQQSFFNGYSVIVIAGASHNRSVQIVHADNQGWLMRFVPLEIVNGYLNRRLYGIC
jgi:hypothetical protein